MNEYPDYNTYERLYARYFNRPSQDLFRGIDLWDKSVLDLCCGNGRATQAALMMGAKKVRMVDIQKEMVPERLMKHSDVSFDCIMVEDIINGLSYNQYNVIVCQQAVNYWFNNVKAEWIADRLTDNGVFVFNTFHNKPSTVPSVKQYELYGIQYCEVSYLIGNTVYHVQMAEGLPMHTTKFDWISPLEFAVKLNPYFQYSTDLEGGTTIWRCWKK